MNTMVTLTAGVRLVFTSDTMVIELTTHPRTLHTVGEPLRRPIYQLLADGVLQPDMKAGRGSVIHIEATRGRHHVRRRRRRDGALGGPRMDVDRPFDAWPAMVAPRSPPRVDERRARRPVPAGPLHGSRHSRRPGGRDQPEDRHQPGERGLDERGDVRACRSRAGDHVRDGHPATPLVVISPIFCPLVEDHPGPTVPRERGGFDIVSVRAAARPLGLTLRRIRAMLASIVDARCSAGDANLH